MNLFIFWEYRGGIWYNMILKKLVWLMSIITLPNYSDATYTPIINNLGILSQLSRLVYSLNNSINI